MALTLSEVSNAGVCSTGYQMARKFADGSGNIVITGKDVRRVRGLLRRKYTTTPLCWADTQMVSYFYSNIAANLNYYVHRVCSNAPGVGSEQARQETNEYFRMLALMLELPFDESLRRFFDALARTIWAADSKQSERLARIINLWVQGLPRNLRRYNY